MQSQYGGFWIRVLAYIIDALILQFSMSIVIAIVMVMVLAVGSQDDAIVGGAVIAAYGLALVANWLYFAIMESSRWQGTVGKQALKLVVTDDHGKRISFGRATGRYFAKIISSLVVVGFFLVGWTPRKQGLHDLIASTLVYRANSPDLAGNSAEVFR